MNRVVHRWLSVLVAIQVMIWVATGLYFNLIDANWHNSDTYRSATSKERCPKNLIPIDKISALYGALYIELAANETGCFYLAHFKQTFHQYQPMQTRTVDATTGEIAEPLTAENARELAIASYTGPGAAISTTLTPGGESSNHKQQNPIWRIAFNDDKQTIVYVHSVTREVIRHENRNSRFHQLMFKLHFMDYFNTGGFNHTLLIVMAMLTCLTFLTGIIWLVNKIRNGQLLR